MKPLNEMDKAELYTTVRRFRLMVRSIGKLIPADADFDRAGGEAECPKCGLTWYEHPENNGLTICCDGRLVKL